MKPTRRDLFTFLGLTALGAALPLKAAGRGTSEEFLIHTGQPLDTVRTILKHLNRTLSTTPVLVGLTPRAEPISRALIREGVAMAPGTDPIWQRWGLSILVQLQVREVTPVKPGFTLLRKGTIVDPRSGSFASLASQIYREESAGYEVIVSLDPSYMPSGTGKEHEAKITVDGATRATLDLRKSSEIRVAGLIGTTHLRAEGGQIFVENAPCRHHICRHRGPIAMPGQRIICAPQRMVIELTGFSGIDAIAG